MTDYKEINKRVMVDTENRCENDPKLIEAIKYSADNQHLYFQEEKIDIDTSSRNEKMIVEVIKARTLEEASKFDYSKEKVAILNFANNHSPGGSPFSAGAQEESICRCSTLYPLLKKLKNEFYEYHAKLYKRGIIDHFGNDDIIYSPEVLGIKTDESEPKPLDEKDYFKFDVITCAAPQLGWTYDLDRYKKTIYQRIKRILDVAQDNKVEVLILGAFGCGAFHNPPEIVSKAFNDQIRNYNFKRVVFAIGARTNDNNYEIFEANIK